MGGVLQRLVDRAVGSGPTGLRPRRPALFEGGGAGAGLEEQHGEVRAAGQWAETRADSVEGVVDSGRGEMPEPLEPLTPRRQEPEADVAEIEARDATEAAPEVRVERVVAREVAEPVDSPKPLLPEARRDLEVTPLAMPVDGAREIDHVSAEPARASLDAAPAPLLGAVPQVFDAALPVVTPSLSRADAPARAEAAPPEITIHIGKLDIRSDPPKAPRPTRAARPASRASAMPSLSDYLRGGGS